jgi:hypothetical protein
VPLTKALLATTIPLPEPFADIWPLKIACPVFVIPNVGLSKNAWPLTIIFFCIKKHHPGIILWLIMEID